MSGGIMQRFLIVMITMVGVLGILSTTACQKKERVSFEEVSAIWEEQVTLIEDYIDKVGQTETPGAAAEQIRVFATGIRGVAPRVNELLVKFSAEEDTPSEAEIENMAKLLAVLSFSDRLAGMELKKFADDPAVKAARRELIDAQALLLKDGLTIGAEIIEQEYKNLMEGKITGGENLERFSEKLGKAGLTSKMKITMRVLLLLGRAIDAFSKDYGYPPEVSSLKELSYYKGFVPLYIDPLPTRDGWGNELHYKTEGNRYWVGSGGSDGLFEGFAQEGVYTELEGKDVILSGTTLVYHPNILNH
jgi:hypothetical protein